jgi:hypothetical protein
VIAKLTALPWQVQAALALLTVVLVVVAAAKLRGGNVDKRAAKLVMLLGLAWSAQAMYEIATGTFHIEHQVALVICGVFEFALWVTTRRAEAAMETFGWPGKAGRTAWILAGGMALVAALNAPGLGGAAFRLAIPLVVTKLWWDGLVGEGAKPEGEESTWLWTPTKIMVRLGLRRPGKNDVATVQRDWLTERMTKLEFARQFGSTKEKDQGKVKMKLAKAALSADQEIIEVVRGRVRLASAAMSGDLSALSDEVVRTELSASAPAVRTDTWSTDRLTDERVRPAQTPAEPMTDADRMQMLASLISTDNPVTGKPWSLRELEPVLGIGRQKISEMKRELSARADNEITDLATGRAIGELA